MTTDRQCFEAVFANLTANDIAHYFGLRGSTGVREDNLNDFKRAGKTAGTTRWIGTHVGSDDCGGAYWGKDGRLYYRTRLDGDQPKTELYFSFPLEHPDLADRLVALFRTVGIKADWSGNIADCVTVRLGA